MICEHQFEYAGIRYKDGSNNLPGTAARRRYYSHVYFCIKCTETKGQSIVDDSYHPQWNSYQKPQFNATPGTAQECGVPLEDLR